MSANRNPILAAVAGLALSVGLAGAAGAQDLAHPRQAQVERRVDRQEHRIRVAEARGVIGPAKAHRLMKAERRVRMAEHRAVMRHHGRLTRMAQLRLNHREAAIGRRIG